MTPCSKNLHGKNAAHSPAADPIVFTGSPSIRLWKTLTRDFPGLLVLNRGFGGRAMTDLLGAFDRVLAPYRPAVSVIYCGKNDIATGRDLIEMADDYCEWLWRCRALQPDMKIAVIAMKPSPKRWALWIAIAPRQPTRGRALQGGRGRVLGIAPLMLGDVGCRVRSSFSRTVCT